tara:strand:- start:2166 stop:3044 length:879 start_codon:yes stop_codon:yes gene_type:complete
MVILDGKKTSNEIKQEIAIEVAKLKSLNRKVPHLAAILVGNNGASETYVAAKVKACELVGFQSTLIRMDKEVSESKLLNEIDKINKDNNIDGLIVQLPLPNQIDEQKIASSILPNKDVDGFHPLNIGRMNLNLPAYLPATPAGIIELLDRYKIKTSGMHCVVIGRSHIVGSPVSILMSRNKIPGNCTVTLTHSKTKNINDIILTADILIVALGIPQFIKGEMLKKGVVIIDVGITRVPSKSSKNGWKLLGDVDFESSKDRCSYITPVPGGVGPMTIAMLLRNTLLSAKKQVY